MKKHTAKRDGLGLEFKMFDGKSGKSYIVFRTTKGGYHAFAEIEAKQAALDCGAPDSKNTRAQWKAVWDAYKQVRTREPVIADPKPAPGKSLFEQMRTAKGKK